MRPVRENNYAYIQNSSVRKTQSLLIPLISAVCALVESSHGLVSRANLDLFEVSLVVLASVDICAEYLCLVDVLPGIVASEYIINFLTLELDFAFKGLIDFKDVRARFAEEAEVR